MTTVTFISAVCDKALPSGASHPIVHAMAVSHAHVRACVVNLSVCVRRDSQIGAISAGGGACAGATTSPPSHAYRPYWA